MRLFFRKHIFWKTVTCGIAMDHISKFGRLTSKICDSTSLNEHFATHMGQTCRFQLLKKWMFRTKQLYSATIGFNKNKSFINKKMCLSENRVPLNPWILSFCFFWAINTITITIKNALWRVYPAYTMSRLTHIPYLSGRLGCSCGIWWWHFNQEQNGDD